MKAAEIRPFSSGNGYSPICPVILSGGAGTRLWPLSRRAYPKQFLPLISGRTMLQETAGRVSGNGFAPPLIVCNDEHRFLVAEQLREIDASPRRIVLEPTGRNTAPAIAAAALLLSAEDPDTLMLVQPSDHHIADPKAFSQIVATAMPAAQRGHLTTFGIAPSRPETGYGYIQTGAPVDGLDGVFSVQRFVEKPDRGTAEQYLSEGGYFWNSGMFLLHAGRYLEELEHLAPDVFRACRDAVARGKDDLDFFRLDPAAFGAAPDISVDYAVMEQTDHAAVVPADIGWSDIGSWRSLRDAQDSDGLGNVVHGDVLLEGVSNSYVHANGKLVAAVGVENIVVVATDDAILVASAERCGEVSRVVERLRRSNRQESLHHNRVYRPWGFYQTMDLGDRFQVKRIMVKPGEKLSLQMHHHRAEHWVVVTGTARVTCDGQSTLLHENESTYIPLGSSHRLENPGKIPLHLIEVQSGAYLGEDDIVRFEDNYGRL